MGYIEHALMISEFRTNLRVAMQLFQIAKKNREFAAKCASSRRQAAEDGTKS